MALSASRILFITCFGSCAYLALQPSQRVESWIDIALIPARVLSELATPLRWSRSRTVAAAESLLTERETADFDARRSLAEAERRAVMPSRAELKIDRRFVHAEVVGRREKHADQLVIAPDNSSCQGLQVGMPVAVGDVFVGRITELDAQDPSRAFVSLVTAKEFTVGAKLDLEPRANETRVDDGGGASVRFVAGGLVERFFIAIHNPSGRVVADMLARVDESMSTLDDFGAQAQDFELGHVVALAGDQHGLQPLLDYGAGLFQVVVVAPSDIQRAPDIANDDVLLDNLLFDEAWHATRSLTCGEPTRGREGLKLASGTWSGARVGAAVVAGVRFVGLVAHAAPMWSDVRTLGDPGLRIPVLARIWGRDAPIALGTFISLGRVRRGDESVLEFEWKAVVPLNEVDERGTSVHATLFTGSGDVNLPRGLVLGEADLPLGVGVHRIVVRQDVDVREVKSLVALPRAAERSTTLKRSSWLAWILVGVWAAWIFALQGLCAAWTHNSSWIPDVGLVLLLSLAARLSHEDLPKAALVIAVARCAVSIDPPVAVIAAYFGATALARGLRGVFEIGGVLPRTLLGLACGWLVTAWFAVVRGLRDARLAQHITGAAPDLGEIMRAFNTAWPPALATALAALVIGPLLAQLPGLTPLRKKRQWHVVASYPWS